MPEILPQIETFARIKVVGVGGGGGNAINRMVASKLRGIEFIAVNTDAQALHFSQATTKVHIGKETTKGLGAGANPDIGRAAAEESEEDIYNALRNAEMVFITGGDGGGTATGAMPIIAKIARDIGALTVAIVTKPFTFEGDRRRKIADTGIDELKDKVDTLIVIPNDRILQLIDRKTSLLDAFGVVDDILRQGVQGISDLITINGLVNLDFADVKSVMTNAGSALMGIGHGQGDDRAVEAAKQAMDSPLLEVSIQGAKGVLVNFTGGRDMGMHEIEEAAKLIHDSVDPEANIIFGTVIDENVNNEIKVTLVATGFDATRNRVTGFGTNMNPIGTTHESITHEELEPEAQPSPFVTSSPRAVIDKDDVTPFIDSQREATPITYDSSTIEYEDDINIEDHPSESISDSTEPIVETVSTAFDSDDEDIEKPAFMRQGKKVKTTSNSDKKSEEKKSEKNSEIPNFIKKKM